jgi:hypothetical protein
VVSLKTRVFDVVRRTLSGRGGATDPHGHQRGVRVLIPTDPTLGEGRGELNSPVSVRPLFGRHGQNGEASGLVPEVLHEHTCRLNSFLEWTDLPDVELENLNDLDSRMCCEYLAHRQENLASTTLENSMRTFRLAVEE